MISIDQASITELSDRFSGVLLRPGESGYDDVRWLHNGMIDKRPGLIASCLGNADGVFAIVVSQIVYVSPSRRPMAKSPAFANAESEVWPD